MPDPRPSRPPDCLRCRSYYVTHESSRPHGCKSFGFTSQRLPRDEVRASTGQECAAFEPRPPRPGPLEPR